MTSLIALTLTIATLALTAALAFCLAEAALDFVADLIND